MLLLVLVHFCPLSLAEDKDRLDDNTITDIRQMVQEINKEFPDAIASHFKRLDLARKVSYIIRDLKQEADIPEVVINDIMTLLGDRDHAVISYAAQALGYMGKKAIRAVPALEKALDEIEEIQKDVTFGPSMFGPSTSPAGSIRRALQSITGKDWTSDPFHKGSKPSP
jgi:hypothetical protein